MRPRYSRAAKNCQNEEWPNFPWSGWGRDWSIMPVISLLTFEFLSLLTDPRWVKPLKNAKKHQTLPDARSWTCSQFNQMPKTSHYYSFKIYFDQFCTWHYPIVTKVVKNKHETAIRKMIKVIKHHFFRLLNKPLLKWESIMWIFSRIKNDMIITQLATTNSSLIFTNWSNQIAIEAW